VKGFIDKETEREIHLLAICFVSSFYFAAQQELQKKSILFAVKCEKQLQGLLAPSVGAKKPLKNPIRNSVENGWHLLAICFCVPDERAQHVHLDRAHSGKKQPEGDQQIQSHTARHALIHRRARHKNNGFADKKLINHILAPVHFAMENVDLEVEFYRQKMWDSNKKFH